ncbi:MAG TPA: DUF1996 domain-containing protein [Gaiellaceae bacterium]|jgi:hypothetical protein
MRRVLRPLAIAVLGLIVCGGGGSFARATPTGAFFVVTCSFSHSAPDDPIVYPRLPHHSHEHAFFGNATTNAFSTVASLSGRKTSCSDPGDASAYWAPTLYVAGTALPPVDATIYYRRLTTAAVKPFPPGLEMVAGNSHAVSRQSPDVTSWYCGVLKSSFYSTMARSPIGMERTPSTAPTVSAAGLPHCPARTHLEVQVNFPNCSDGKATSSDHASHMAYSVAGRCPSSHPIPVPAISISLRYPQITSANVFLSSGGIFSAHADFMDAWNQKALTRLVDSCLNLGRNCGTAASPAPDIS